MAPCSGRRARRRFDEELRTAFKVATIEAGTSMQDALIAFIEEYSAATLKRLRHKS